MEIIRKKFDELSTRELYSILRARSAVFVVEQNCAYQDIDGVDFDACHIYTTHDGELSAYLRVFMRDEATGTAQIGRVITVKRGCGLGLVLLREGIREAFSRDDVRSIYLEAQTYAVGFYEKAGFRVASDEFMEDGIPHVVMTLERTSPERTEL